MIRRPALAAGLSAALLALLPGEGAAQRPGIYDVTGVNLDGTPYSGVAQIRTAGLSSFIIAWRIGNQVVEGVGFASGRTIAMAYGLAQRPGIAIYTLNPDGSMEGEWTVVGAPANARERLVPRPEAAGDTPAAAPAAPPPVAAPSAPPPPVTPPAAPPATPR